MIRGLARLAVSNPVGANLLMIALAVGGLVTYAGMPREVFPNFSLDAIEVLTALPGAAPVDVERLVTTPIEDALDGLDGVKEMRSTSREGEPIKLTLTPDAEPVEVLAGARDRVRGGGLVPPEDAEEPFVHEVENQFPVIAVFVYGSADLLTLKRLAEDEARGSRRSPGSRTSSPPGSSSRASGSRWTRTPSSATVSPSPTSSEPSPRASPRRRSARWCPRRRSAS